MKLNCNCCDGIYNSVDVHFTEACDNKCAHCVDTHYNGIGIVKPDLESMPSHKPTTTSPLPIKPDDPLRKEPSG